MAGRSKKQTVQRPLRLENLESRRVWAVVDGLDDLTLATKAVAVHHFTESYSGRVGYEATQRLATKAALSDALRPQIQEYWSEFFGQSPADAFQVSSSLSAVLDVIETSSFPLLNFSTTAVTADGFLYTVNGDNDLDVIDWTDRSAPVTRLTIPGTDYQMSILVEGNRLVTLESVGNLLLQGEGVREYGRQTKINSYDIADRAHPSLTGSAIVDGIRVAAELKADTLTLVLRTLPYIPAPQLQQGANGAWFESAAEYQQRIGDELFDALLPDISIQTAGGVVQPPINMGSWQDLIYSPGSIAYSNTVVRLNIGGVPNVVASETVIGRTSDSAVLIADDDVYLANLQSVVRVHTQADGELVSDASIMLPGRVESQSWMDGNDGVLRVVSTLDGQTFVTTLGDTAGGWSVLGQLALTGSYPYSVGFSDGMALLELRGSNEQDNWLQVVDVSHATAPRALGRQASHGLSLVLGIGSDRFIVSTYDISSFYVSLYDVSASGDLVSLDRWQSTDGNAGGQAGVKLGLDSGWLKVQYTVANNSFYSADDSHTLRLFDLSRTDAKTLSNAVTYATKYEQDYVSEYGPVQLVNYPTVSVIDAVVESLGRKDVNRDGLLTALDVLLLVNRINYEISNPPDPVRPSPQFFRGDRHDVNHDGYVTALDVLQLVNAINSSIVPAASLDAPPLDDLQKRKA